MNRATRAAVWRANAVFLTLASLAGLFADFAGAFFGVGPFAATLQSQPYMAIGQVEAHGLALILGLSMWWMRPSRANHMALVCVHLLFGISNLIFWQSFVASGLLIAGYGTTAFHALFVTLEGIAAAQAKSGKPSRGGHLETD